MPGVLRTRNRARATNMAWRMPFPPSRKPASIKSSAKLFVCLSRPLQVAREGPFKSHGQGFSSSGRIQHFWKPEDPALLDGSSASGRIQRFRKDLEARGLVPWSRRGPCWGRYGPGGTRRCSAESESATFKWLQVPGPERLVRVRPVPRAWLAGQRESSDSEGYDPPGRERAPMAVRLGERWLGSHGGRPT